MHQRVPLLRGGHTVVALLAVLLLPARSEAQYCPTNGVVCGEPPQGLSGQPIIVTVLEASFVDRA
jgi:hypothetical protein